MDSICLELFEGNIPSGKLCLFIDLPIFSFLPLSSIKNSYVPFKVSIVYLKVIISDGFLKFFIQHCFIFRHSDSTMSEDAWIEPRIVAMVALAISSNSLTWR